MNKVLNNILNNSFNKKIKISGSKSESNRLLILKQQFSNLNIDNLGNADDVLILKNALMSNKEIINIGHAGTAMRFLTAYFSTIEKTVILTGSNRMQKRPIKILVNVLRQLGANITYLKEEGFPPIKITGNKKLKNKITIDGSVSSQYISALLLIAPRIENGLIIELIGNVTSKPYIEMTLSILNKIGVKTYWVDNTIKVLPKKKIENTTITVESDWSSASYFYSLVALSKNGEVSLSNFNFESLQGDKDIAIIYQNFGVKTIFNTNEIVITQIKKFQQKKHITLNLIKTPDIAQTIAVTCFGLGISCDLTGLHTLKIKETDRLKALKIELSKLGAKVIITNDSFHLKNTKNISLMSKDQRLIKTYQDHRMAMAFAPLALLLPITIENANVVSKSYPNFWNDFKIYNS